VFADVIFICNTQFRNEGKSCDKKDCFSNELRKYEINDLRTTIDRLFFTCHLHTRIILLKNIKPTRFHLLFYCTSYRLNMFRALLCPSSGARDYDVDYHIGRFGVGLL